MSKKQLSKRRRQLRNLVVMALADGSLGEREVNLVADRCADLGLDEYDLQKAVEFGLGDDAALELPNDESDRKDLMRDLIRMMAADGKIGRGREAIVRSGCSQDVNVGHRR